MSNSGRKGSKFTITTISTICLCGEQGCPRVRFVLDLDSTRNFRVGENRTRNRLGMLVGSSGSGLVRFWVVSSMMLFWPDLSRSGQITTRSHQISSNLDQISMGSCRISLRSCWISLDLDQISTRSHRISLDLMGFQVIFVGELQIPTVFVSFR